MSHVRTSSFTHSLTHSLTHSYRIINRRPIVPSPQQCSDRECGPEIHPTHHLREPLGQHFLLEGIPHYCITEQEDVQVSACTGTSTGTGEWRHDGGVWSQVREGAAEGAEWRRGYTHAVRSKWILSPESARIGWEKKQKKWVSDSCGSEWVNEWWWRCFTPTHPLDWSYIRNNLFSIFHISST
jgi:hypothetical protein